MRWSRCMSLLPWTTLHSDSEQGFWVLRNSPSLNLLLINILTQDYLCYLQEKWLPMVSKNSLVLVISIGLYRGRRPKQQRPWLKKAKRICRSFRLKEKKLGRNVAAPGSRMKWFLLRFVKLFDAFWAIPRQPQQQTTSDCPVVVPAGP